MKLKHWIRIIIFVGICIGLVAFSSFFFCIANEKDTVGVYGFYKEPEDSISVVLIGTSNIYTSFYSPMAYEKYGFTSYNLSTSSMPSAVFKSAVQIAEEKQHPDLYVVDIWGFCYKDQLNEVSVRKWLDSLPKSDIKNQTIEELVSKEDWESFKHPFIKYHARWNDLGGCLKVLQDKITMDKIGYSITKNYATIPNIIPYEEQKENYRISEAGLKYLDEFLEYCKQEGIENILFVRNPEFITFTEKDSYYELVDKIHNAGYDFLNMEAVSEEMGIDVTHDYYNSSHLNVFGTEKYTNYLSQYLLNHYDINKNYAPEVKKEWDNCASYNTQVLDRLKYLTENCVSGYLYIQKDFF